MGRALETAAVLREFLSSRESNTDGSFLDGTPDAAPRAGSPYALPLWRVHFALQVNHWHIITPEYAPQSGGVADYTRQVAEGLRGAGDRVEVWCRGEGESCTEDPPWVHRDLRAVTPGDLWRTGRKIDRYQGPRRLLVQWVPHGFGWRSMNLPFCCWLLLRSLRGDEIDLMVHEPFLSFREGTLKQDLAAGAHRMMAIVLLQAASRVWLSTSAWEKPLRAFALGRKMPFGWLPVPSNIPVCGHKDGLPPPQATSMSPEKTVLGHFSSYSLDIAVLLRRIIPSLLSCRANWVIQLLGRGSERFREQMIEAHPGLRDQILATGQASTERLSERLAACDIMLQPYPDGATTRRTTLMATLEHGLPVVTTVGKLSENFWAGCDAVAAVPADDTDRFTRTVVNLVNDRAERTRMGRAASAFYADHFGLSKVIRDLRSSQIRSPQIGGTHC